GSTLVPERYRFLLGLNPMTGVVEGFRWALLGKAAPASQTSIWILGLSLAIVLITLISGAFFFRATEQTFADVI
ncbi:MAG: ABC transporter permease, partial [Chloroflexi bacterium]|nr:ABC transporter permease [Chloroflexota bacterium]